MDEECHAGESDTIVRGGGGAEEEREMMERVAALERWVQRMQVSQKARDEWSTRQIRSLERQLSAASLPATFALSPLSSSSSPSAAAAASASCAATNHAANSLPSSPSLASPQQRLIRSPRLAYSTSFKKPEVPCVFQMPLHYPRYCRADYDSMPEWKLDRLLEEYGLPVTGTLPEKKQYAIGVFLWN